MSDNSDISCADMNRLGGLFPNNIILCQRSCSITIHVYGKDSEHTWSFKYWICLSIWGTNAREHSSVMKLRIRSKSADVKLVPCGSWAAAFWEAPAHTLLLIWGATGDPSTWLAAAGAIWGWHNKADRRLVKEAWLFWRSGRDLIIITGDSSGIQKFEMMAEKRTPRGWRGFYSIKLILENNYIRKSLFGNVYFCCLFTCCCLFCHRFFFCLFIFIDPS